MSHPVLDSGTLDLVSPPRKQRGRAPTGLRRAVLILGFLAGCGADPPVPMPKPTPFDGQYDGASWLGAKNATGDADVCTSKPIKLSIIVNSGQFTYTWGPGLYNLGVNVSITPDGVIQGSESYAILTSTDPSRHYLTVQGHATPEALRFTVHGPGCNRIVVVDRIRE